MSDQIIAKKAREYSYAVEHGRNTVFRLSNELIALCKEFPTENPAASLAAITAPLQARIADLKGALEVLSCLGNEPYPGNSKGNVIAQQALAKSPAESLKTIQDAALAEYLKRQREWSRKTFGPSKRTRGIIQHISKELLEIEAKPEDLSEWIDVVILAMDGYWRHGGTPERFMGDLQAKQDKNFARTWPTPKSEDEAVEHNRGNGEEAKP